MAISNRNYAGPGNMLDIWIDNVKAAGVKNAMVVALDSFTKDHVLSKGFPVIEMHEQVRSAALLPPCGRVIFKCSFTKVPGLRMTTGRYIQHVRPACFQQVAQLVKLAVTAQECIKWLVKRNRCGGPAGVLPTGSPGFLEISAVSKILHGVFSAEVLVHVKGDKNVCSVF